MENSSLRKRALALMFLVAIGLFAINSYAQFAGGNGTGLDPYLIETPEHLNNVRDFLSSHFRLVNDIDLSPEELQGEDWYDTVNGWLPIGTEANGFRGSLDGNNFVIHNLTINRPALDYCGLFGMTVGVNLMDIGLKNPNVTGRERTAALGGNFEGGVIQRCYVEGGSVRGFNRVGGLLGNCISNTQIDYCYASTDVLQSNQFIGGLVGFLSTSTFLTNSYSTSYVESAAGDAGGLAGYSNGGRVTNCYSTGFINSTAANVGGLIGRVIAPVNVFTSYWNTESSGRLTGGTNVPAALARTTAQMVTQANYEGWNFENLWAISEGTYPFLRWQPDTPRNFNYPVANALTAISAIGIVNLQWQAPAVGNPQSYRIYRNGEYLTTVNHPTVQYADGAVVNYQSYQYYIVVNYTAEIQSGPSNKATAMPYEFAGGTGTADDPYLVQTVDQLNFGVRMLLNLHFRQIANIDLGVLDNWLPIGRSGGTAAPTAEFRFTGSYDGNGFTISNMTSNLATTYVALFSYAQNATFTNIKFENVNLTGTSYVAALAGYLMTCNVSDIHITGNITSTAVNSYSGGLAGYINQTPVNRCSFIGIVTGNRYLGGLVGYMMNAPTELNFCFTSGEVNGDGDTGGLVGYAARNGINNSYSTSNVTGGTNVGGLVGYQANTCPIINSYSTGSVRARGANAGGLVGTGAGGAFATNSYWNTETSRQELSFTGAGLTTTQMLRQGSFEDWDFDAGWNMLPERSYPYHRWQTVVRAHNIPTPHSLTATVGDGNVRLNWQPPYAFIPAAYNIYKDGVNIGSVNHPTNQYVDNDVENFVTYSYYITAVHPDELFSAPSNIVKATPFAFAGGSGTQVNPYQVSNAQQLNHIRYILDAYYIQTANIDLGVAPWNEGQGWNPIGSAATPFTGTYDGDGFLISNLYIERFGLVANQALFSHINGAVFKNIGMDNVWVRASGNAASLVVNAVGSQILNCYIESGYLRTSGFYLGGLAETVRNTTVSQCYNNATVHGRFYTGGLIHSSTDGSVVSNSYNSGTVYGSGVAGGLIGGHANVAGNLVTNCYSTGRFIWDGASPSYGGLIGAAGGTAGPPGEVVNSYWNMETAGVTISAGTETGLVTTDMIVAASFEDWNFDTIWNIVPGETYPYLRWQETPADHNIPSLVPPTNLRGVGSNNQVNLNWDAPGFGEPTQYKIYMGGTNVATIPAVITEFEMAGLDNYRTYSFRVSAVYNGDESAPSTPWSVVPFPGFAGGSGTEEDPYLIGNAQQLNDIKIVDDNYYRFRHFRQIADVDLAVYPDWYPIGVRVTEAWRPTEGFIGSYDGAGYSIFNLTITSDLNDSGLFGYIEAAKLSNIRLIDVNITGGGNHKAALVGWSDAHNSWNNVPGSIITNCYVSGTINVTGNRIGGLIGYAQFTRGAEQDAGVLADSKTNVSITSTGTDLGGLIGYSSNGNIERCAALGNVSTENDYAGVLIGRSSSDKVTYCYTTGDVEGRNYIGGLIGSSTRTQITDSFSTGSVTGTRHVGGFIGDQYEAPVTNCFSAGRVSSQEDIDVGGFVGSIRFAPEFDNCYWDTERSGREVSAGGEGRLSRQMRYPHDQTTFIDWDFDEIWVGDEGYEPEVSPGINQGYPYLWWQTLDRLDTPIVRIEMNQLQQPVLSWGAIDGANSYKIYATDDPNNPHRDWTLIATTANTQYIDTSDIERMKFYTVVASSEMDDGRAIVPPRRLNPADRNSNTNREPNVRRSSTLQESRNRNR